jgi:RNA polymerase sigma factor (sigma-70 family)
VKCQFEQLLKQHDGELRRLARKLAGNPDDADDLYQDVAIKLFTKADRWNPELGTWIAWALTTMRNTFIDGKRSRAGKQTVEIPANLKLRPSYNDGETALMLQELNEVIDTKLTPSERRSFRTVAAGARYREAAEELRTPPGTVKSDLSHARVKLREHFGVRKPKSRRPRRRRRAVELAPAQLPAGTQAYRFLIGGHGFTLALSSNLSVQMGATLPGAPAAPAACPPARAA